MTHTPYFFGFLRVVLSGLLVSGLGYMAFDVDNPRSCFSLMLLGGGVLAVLVGGLGVIWTF